MPDKAAGETKTVNSIEIPKLYSVVLHYDDFTPMDFVVFILMKIFNKNEADAKKIMLQVHKQGSGVAGIYPLDIAATKKIHSEILAGDNGHPLKLSLEQE